MRSFLLPPRLALCLWGVAAWTSLAHAASLRVVPTYENAGIYVEPAPGESLDPASLHLFYREKDASGPWLDAHPLTSSANDPVPRGSLFGLRQHTAYEVRCDGPGGATLASADFQTRADSPPVARTVNIRELSPDGDAVIIDQSGTPGGWIRYTADPGQVIDGSDLADEAILVKNARYIILDGLTVRGGRRHGIRLENSRDILVTRCDISGFGRVGTQDTSRDGKFYLPGDTKAINWDAGVAIDLSGDLTIERSFIHDPRSRANSWFFSHPAGPNAVFVRSTGGVVIRYNDFVGSDTHRWNDVIESYGNGNPDGGFHRDSDIYGNFLAFPNDDGIEIDGGQCNVRLYGNKIEGGLCGISTASNRVGPSFIFDNLVVNLADERGASSTGVKNGGGSTYSQGTTFFYNNTFLTFGRGISAVGYGKDADRGMFLAHARNNLFATTGLGIDDSVPSPRKSYDHDAFAGALRESGEYSVADGTDAETHGLVAAVSFADAPRGLLALAPGSPARSAGVPVPGFSTLLPTPVPVGAWSPSLPLRPVPASLDAGQLFLTAYGSSTASGKVTLSSTASAPLPFRILKTDASSWLSVEPSSGTLQPGQSLSLTVSFDPAALTARGLLLGAAIVKFADGLSLPLTVYAVSSPAPLRRLFEAGSLDGSAAFSRIEDPASSSSALRFFDESAGRSGKGTKTLTLSFDLPAPSACYLAFRTRSPRPYGDHDSLFISVNGAKPVPCALTGSGQWAWSRLTGQSAHLDLPAGPNRITLIPREDLDLDAVLLSDRPLMPGDDLAAFLQPSTSPQPQ